MNGGTQWGLNKRGVTWGEVDTPWSRVGVGRKGETGGSPKQQARGWQRHQTQGCAPSPDEGAPWGRGRSPTPLTQWEGGRDGGGHWRVGAL